LGIPRLIAIAGHAMNKDDAAREIINQVPASLSGSEVTDHAGFGAAERFDTGREGLQ
jgi:hypothetical protein